MLILSRNIEIRASCSAQCTVHGTAPPSASRYPSHSRTGLDLSRGLLPPCQAPEPAGAPESESPSVQRIAPCSGYARNRYNLLSIHNDSQMVLMYGSIPPNRFPSGASLPRSHHSPRYNVFPVLSPFSLPSCALRHILCLLPIIRIFSRSRSSSVPCGCGPSTCAAIHPWSAARSPCRWYR